MNTVTQSVEFVTVKSKSKNNGIHVAKDAPGDIRNIYTVIAQATDEERTAGMLWYFHANMDATTLAAEFDMPLWVVCQVLSVISPQRRWEVNVRDCRKVIMAHRLPVEQRIPSLKGTAAPSGWQAFERAWEILDGTREMIRKGAPKTYDFAMTIMHPDTYMEPVIDSHAGALWTDEYHMTPGCYAYSLGLYTKIANDYKTVAASMGIMPHQAQAIAWVVRRRLMGSESPSSF